MIRYSRVLFTVLIAFLASGCVALKTTVFSSKVPLEKPIHTIALMPSGGVLADAIGLELLQFGFDIIDTARVPSILIRDNLSEIELAQPQNLLLLHQDGIEVIIFAKAVAGYDSKPQSINIKIIQTLSGRLLTGVNWQMVEEVLLVHLLIKTHASV